jgi:hypothetical protein
VVQRLCRCGVKWRCRGGAEELVVQRWCRGSGTKVEEWVQMWCRGGSSAEVVQRWCNGSGAGSGEKDKGASELEAQWWWCSGAKEKVEVQVQRWCRRCAEVVQRW